MNIILISAEEVRKKWISNYHEAEKKLSKIKREWNTFENEAYSAYQQWYYSGFAQKLSELSVIGEEIRELQVILSAVELQIEVNHLTKKAALDHVLSAVSEKRDPFPDEEEIFRHEEAERRAFTEAFYDTFGESSDLLDAVEENHSEKDYAFESLPVVQLDGTQQKEDYKTLYRQIVKRLHPDRGEEMSPSEKNLWSEAQNAYQSKNKEVLQTILLRVEGGGIIRIHALDSVGEIIHITETLRAEYREIQVQQRKSKKDPVYRFWASRNNSKNRQKLYLEMEHQLRMQLYLSRQDLKNLRSELESLKRATQKKKRK